MSKGSKRRPTTVSKDEHERRWAGTFGAFVPANLRAEEPACDRYTVPVIVIRLKP